MEKRLLTAFWNCGDDAIIQFALQRAHLNRHEREVIRLMLDECYSQEETADLMHYSVRRIQDYWHTASLKLLNIAWVRAYARELS